MASTWYIKASLPLSQKASIEATLAAHGIPRNHLREVEIVDGSHSTPFLELIFPVPYENGLMIVEALAHAAKTEMPKSSKIFLLPEEQLVTLR